MKSFKRIMLFSLILFVSLLITGCGSNEKDSDIEKYVASIEESEVKITSTDNYYSPRAFSLIKNNDSGLLSVGYYDFDKDGEDELLVSRVKDDDLVLSLYNIENDELKEYDSIILYEDFLDFPDTIYMNCFIKMMPDNEPYIFAESASYSNLVADGANWWFRKVGFAKGKFFDIAQDEFSGSYFEEGLFDNKKEFIVETDLKADIFVLEENGKMLYEQNKDKAIDLFTIKREHIPTFDETLYFDSDEAAVKYGETKFSSGIEKNHDLKSFLK